MPLVKPEIETWTGPPVAQNGGGGDNGGVEARLAKLEAMVPTLATSEQLNVKMADLRTEMHKEFTAQTWRIIGAMLTFGAMLSAAVFFIARNVR